MTLLPEHGFQWINAGWFSLLYGVLSLLLMAFLPQERRRRILTFPKFANKREKLFSGLALFLFGRGLLIYSFFIPLKLFTIPFYIGTAIYFFGMASSIGAMVIFARADLAHPVSSGIYRITRHPMQVMSLFMWAGIGIAAGTWMLPILALVMGALSYPSLRAQERFCLEKYGEEYREYAQKVPRYLLVKSSLPDYHHPEITVKEINP